MKGVVIQVMKDYGVKESWIKFIQFVLPILDSKTTVYPTSYSKPCSRTSFNLQSGKPYLVQSD